MITPNAPSLSHAVPNTNSHSIRPTLLSVGIFYPPNVLGPKVVPNLLFVF